MTNFSQQVLKSLVLQFFAAFYCILWTDIVVNSIDERPFCKGNVSWFCWGIFLLHLFMFLLAASEEPYF